MIGTELNWATAMKQEYEKKSDSHSIRFHYTNQNQKMEDWKKFPRDIGIKSKSTCFIKTHVSVSWIPNNKPDKTHLKSNTLDNFKKMYEKIIKKKKVYKNKKKTHKVWSTTFFLQCFFVDGELWEGGWETRR